MNRSNRDVRFFEAQVEVVFSGRLMSALGQKQKFGPFITTSAVPPKADIAECN
jgi:hypothetical protein